MRVIVAGMIGGTPNQGGAAWAVLQYVLGLQRLGHDVLFVEPLSDVCVGPTHDIASTESWWYVEAVAASFGLEGHCALIEPASRTAAGMSYQRVEEAFESADLLLNFSGIVREPGLVQKPAIRVYVDLDPGFTQLWQAEQGIDMGFAGHTHFVTVGPRIGTEACPVPTCGRDWIGTLPPVVLDRWPVATDVCRDSFTTIANWRAYGSIEYGGAFYGQKAHSLRQFIGAPLETNDRFELALSIHPDEERDLAALIANGWSLMDPGAVAGTPQAYREFIAGSSAEFGIAKSGYVRGATGWLSDRSVCYLASGRPVLAQETGFTSLLPVGDGLLAFETMEELADGVRAIRGDYQRHSRAAREVAEAYFDSDRVLNRLLDRIAI